MEASPLAAVAAKKEQQPVRDGVVAAVAAVAAKKEQPGEGHRPAVRDGVVAPCHGQKSCLDLPSTSVDT